MWNMPLPSGPLLPEAPFLVPIPGLGPVLALVGIAVVVGLAWLIGWQAGVREWRVVCPIDQAACAVVADRKGRVVTCLPRPGARGVHCDARCLAA